MQRQLGCRLLVVNEEVFVGTVKTFFLLAANFYRDVAIVIFTILHYEVRLNNK